MSKTTISIISIIMVAIVIAGGAYWYIQTKQSGQTGKACTMEAKLCPDGSAVGRTGPNCEFTPCPDTTAATSTEKGILPYNSGIRGQVMLGPTCPVERIPPDPNCADKPYQTRVAIFRASDPVHAILFTNTDAGGTFSASLPPGDYTLGAGQSNLPRCDRPQVTVGPNAFVSVTISCDTGIR